MRRFAVALFVALAAGSPGKAAGAETTLRLAMQLPLGSALGQNVAAFKDIVESESGGEIEIEIFDSARLYKDKEVPQAVAAGAVEMGVVSFSHLANSVPAVDLLALPFLFDNAAAVAAATAPGHAIRETLDGEIAKTGASPLWWQAYGLGVMLSNGAPLVSPAQIEGKKVRVFGAVSAALVAAAGGVPTLLSGAEQYLAYRRGTVAAGMTSATAVTQRKLYEVMDVLTDTNHAAIEFAVLIYEEAWQGLDKQQHDLLSSAARRVEAELRADSARDRREAMAWLITESDMRVVGLNAAQREAWRSATRSVIDTYISAVGPLGARLVAEARSLQQQPFGPR